ncbi:MAG TPA: molybdopterin converting factor subunit 1 [Persephonella sp.]|nr:molybdopterin converting factor subunit 1 [Hydrogenothermaceae bacterium]HIQ24936.1 molybdopterin converting factor subunit 1 [Persephonella sp.]
MKIKVLYFSSVKDKLKKQIEEFEIRENTTIEEFISLLQEKYPEIKDVLKNIMIAVNEEYKDKKYILKNNDVVAIIPPVSGG